MIPTPANLKALDGIAKVVQRFPIDGQPGLVIQITGRPGAPILSWVFRYRIPGPDGKPVQVNHTLGRWPERSWPQVKAEMIDLRAKAKAGVRLAPPRLTREGAFEAVKAAAAKVDRSSRIVDLLQVVRETEAEKVGIRAELAFLDRTPPPVPEDTTPTVKEIAERWYIGHVKAKNQPTTQAWQRWALDKHVLPGIGDLKITEATRSKVFAFLDGLASTPVTANRTKALLSKLWTWSEARNDVMASLPNPTRGWERHAEQPRERRLSEAEIVTLGKAYRKSPSALNTAVMFILLTGCREGAVFAMNEETKVEDSLIRFAPGMPGLKGCRRIYVPPVAAARS